MNEAEIAELFIKAAEVDRRLPNTARPATMKSQSLPFVHDWADINGWDSEEKKAREWEWTDPTKQKLRTIDIGIWEMAADLIAKVEHQTERRCLLAWASAKAGGKPFAQWCRKEGFHEITGTRRKDRAIVGILLSLGCKVLQHKHKRQNTVLPVAPEISDKSVTITQHASVWRAEDARPMACDFDHDLTEFSWADQQNQRRREREARRRAKLEAA